jgi:hypothetical protein
MCQLETGICCCMRATGMRRANVQSKTRQRHRCESSRAGEVTGSANSQATGATHTPQRRHLAGSSGQQFVAARSSLSFPAGTKDGRSAPRP